MPINNGAETSQLPVSIAHGQVLSSDVVHASFWWDWYDTIHIAPNVHDLGNLLSDQSREFEVWNAYVSSQLLNAIDADGADGLNLDEPDPAPTTFAPLESRIYSLQISTDGPPSIDAVYTFNFAGDTLDLTVSGERVVVWPYGPNWRQPVEETLEWLNDVIPSDDGHEQCLRLRDAPRRVFSYLMAAHQSDRRRMHALLWDWQARVFALPVWMDNGRLEAAASAGALSLSLQTDYLDYHDGGLAVLFGSVTNQETVEIETVGSSNLTLSRETQSAWPANTRVYPVRLARMIDRQQLNRYTSVLDEALLEFDIEENSALAPAEFNATTYLSYPVLEARPNWRENRTVEYQRLLQSLDNQTGVKAVDDMSGLPITIQSFLWTNSGRADIHDLRQWLHARAGRLTRIWIPTDQADLILAETAQDTDNFIKVENIGYTRFLAQDKGRRDIAIILKSGQRLYRRITGSAEIGSTVEQLDIDAPLGVTVTPDDVVKISWLQLSRMASDGVRLTWYNRQLQECQHNLRSVYDDV